MKIYDIQNFMALDPDHVIDVESLWIYVSKYLKIIPNFNTKSPMLTRESDQTTYAPMLLHVISKMLENGPVAIGHIKNGQVVVNETKMDIAKEMSLMNVQNKPISKRIMQQEIARIKNDRPGFQSRFKFPNELFDKTSCTSNGSDLYTYTHSPEFVEFAKKSENVFTMPFRFTNESGKRGVCGYRDGILLPKNEDQLKSLIMMIKDPYATPHYDTATPPGAVTKFTANFHFENREHEEEAVFVPGHGFYLVYIKTIAKIAKLVEQRLKYYLLSQAEGVSVVQDPVNIIDPFEFAFYLHYYCYVVYEPFHPDHRCSIGINNQLYARKQEKFNCVFWSITTPVMNCTTLGLSIYGRDVQVTRNLDQHEQHHAIKKPKCQNQKTWRL